MKTQDSFNQSKEKRERERGRWGGEKEVCPRVFAVSFIYKPSKTKVGKKCNRDSGEISKT